ncbi:hypothetical protein, partial [Nocardioides sp.]
MRLVDLPEPLPAGSRLLHIGLPKTGTTALQAALHAARDELESRGVHNVSKSRHPLAAAAYGAGRTDDSDDGRLSRRWTQLAGDFATSRARQTLLSSEALCAAAPDRISALKEQLGEDLYVVVTLRSLTALLPSLWQQRVKEGAATSFDDWLHAVLRFEADGGFRLGGYDLDRIIDDWGSRFGEDRLVFFIGDPTDRLFTLRAFESLLGVSGVLKLPSMDNAALPFAEVEMLRAFNLIHDGQDEDAARWAEVVRGVARQMGERPADGGRADAAWQRITAPRWLAEAANEHARRSIAELEGSDALVVGDPRFLLADPQRQPEEVAVPDQVSVQAAAWFADR